jgi:NADP-dependent aldehyde dehydrogenase
MALSHQIAGKHLINGTWIGDAEAFDAIAPASGDVIGPRFAEAGESEVNLAALAADSAFDATRDLPPRWQADLLDTIGGKIVDLGDALLERAEAETALPRGRLTMERGRTVNQLKMFAQVVRDGAWVDATIDTADPKRAPMPKPDVRRMLRPRGPVAVFGASNFPFAFSAVGGDTASALAAGCPVIVKGHPSHPGTSELFAAAVLAALHERRLPAGLFAMLQGRSHELSGALVRHPSIHAVGFTGSQRAGRALFDLAASRPSPIPVFAEMGSINPLVILPAALAERGEAIARELAGSILLGGGQFCTKPGVTFVVGERGGTFIDALSKAVAAAAPVTMLNGGLRDNFARRAREMSSAQDVRTLVGPKPQGNAAMSPGLFETTAKTFQSEPTLREEAFGPAGVVVRCDTVDEAIACVEQIEGSLTGTVHVGRSEDTAAASRVLRALESHVGRLIVNGYPTGVEVNHAMIHGGPYPATTDAGTTSVGSSAIRRFARPVAFQDAPDLLLPPELQNANPLKIVRLVNGQRTDRPI